MSLLFLLSYSCCSLNPTRSLFCIDGRCMYVLRTDMLKLRDGMNDADADVQELDKLKTNDGLICFGTFNAAVVGSIEAFTSHLIKPMLETRSSWGECRLLGKGRRCLRYLLVHATPECPFVCL